MGDNGNATVEALEKGFVEGLKFKIPSDKLAKLMRDRASYHETRAKQKKKELPKLRASLETIGRAPKISAVSNKFSSGMSAADVVEELEKEITEHQNKVVSFRFRADNVIPKIDYILTEGDLRSLEVIK